ncbi:hypothetical protein [Actinoplanes sp. NPDC051411]|uniref:hypothetical protein n=1 Tax=Actinoplanes sp. NPDC051411 TaxID=3155522 RepID=UPI00344A3C50
MAVDQETEESPGFGRRPASGGKAAEEKATFRLAAYGALLVVVLFAGYGLGRLNSGPTGAADSTKTQSAAGPGEAPTKEAPTKTASGAADNSMPGMAMDESEPHAHNADGTVTQTAIALPAGSVVGGLSLSSAGLTLVPLGTTFRAGRIQRLGFRIAGADGVPVTTFAVVHDKLLHLIVVRRDLTGYQHLHPTMAADGTWTIDLTLARPGIYRMIADFTAVVGGRQIAAALGGDLTVAGSYAPAPLPPPARASRTGGFGVVYEGTPDTRSVQPVLMSVTGPDGKPAALQPYLGAFGHLVMIRQGDLGYVHIHPEPQLVDGKVKFWLTAPSRGTYRMFFDFQVAGQVHDAAWTVTIKQ